MQTDSEERILRVGESGDLYGSRYKGGTAFAIEAAMHGSRNLFFAAEAPKNQKERRRLEATMIYELQPQYCNYHRKYAPLNPVKYTNEGDLPKGIVEVWKHAPD